MPLLIAIRSFLLGFNFVCIPFDSVNSGLNVIELITLIFSLVKISIISFKIAASPSFEAFIILGIKYKPLKSNLSDDNLGLLTLPAKSTFLHFFSLIMSINFPNCPIEI